MLMFQSLRGIPTDSILRLMLCSMGNKTTQFSLPGKSQKIPSCCTKTLVFYCLFVTAYSDISVNHSVICFLGSREQYSSCDLQDKVEN